MYSPLSRSPRSLNISINRLADGRKKEENKNTARIRTDRQLTLDDDATGRAFAGIGHHIGRQHRVAPQLGKPVLELSLATCQSKNWRTCVLRAPA